MQPRNPERVPWHGHGATGERYGELPPGLAEALPLWIRTGTVPEAEALKPGSVFKWGAQVVKFFPPPHLWRRMGRSKARISAERHFELLPLRTPRPVLALERVGPERRGSLLVAEYVAGSLLMDLWQRDEAAMAALVPFLVELRRRRIIHGDLHPRNLLWDGREWVLLDLAAVRHRLHRVFASRRESAQWVSLLHFLRDDAGVEALHRDYAARLGLDARAEWDAVRARHERLRAERARRLAGRG